MKNRHPSSPDQAPPECDDKTLRYAYNIGSTTYIINFAWESTENEFIIEPKPSVIQQMRKHNSEKNFIPLTSNNGCACNEHPQLCL